MQKIKFPAINTAGVRWVIRLQLLLLGFLCLAVLDFFLGVFFTIDEGILSYVE